MAHPIRLTLTQEMRDAVHQMCAPLVDNILQFVSELGGDDLARIFRRLRDCPGRIHGDGAKQMRIGAWMFVLRGKCRSTHFDSMAHKRAAEILAGIIAKTPQFNEARRKWNTEHNISEAKKRLSRKKRIRELRQELVHLEHLEELAPPRKRRKLEAIAAGC